MLGLGGRSGPADWERRQRQPARRGPEAPPAEPRGCPATTLGGVQAESDTDAASFRAADSASFGLPTADPGAAGFFGTGEGRPAGFFGTARGDQT